MCIILYCISTFFAIGGYDGIFTAMFSLSYGRF